MVANVSTLEVLKSPPGITIKRPNKITREMSAKTQKLVKKLAEIEKQVSEFFAYTVDVP